MLLIVEKHGVARDRCGYTDKHIHIQTVLLYRREGPSPWIGMYARKGCGAFNKTNVKGCCFYVFNPSPRTTVGYGDITSANDLERCAAIVGMIIGATVFGYIIGNVAVIMENFDIEDAIETTKMNQIKDWLYDRKVKTAVRHSRAP